MTLVRLRTLRNDFAKNTGRTKFVVVARDEELGLRATWQKLIGIVSACGLDRDSEADYSSDPRIAAGGPKAGVGAEGEACEEYWLGKLVREVVQSGSDIVDLAASVVVRAFAATSPAKVEAEDR